jgi:cyclopropane-fatty-acyl-phospholipid synthase
MRAHVAAVQEHRPRNARVSRAAATIGASQTAIAYHYDLNNDFYRLFLDSTFSYSCAKFDRLVANESLKVAQEKKLDYHLDQVNCRWGESLLDVGCGWGALLQRAISKYQVKRVVGLTLSEKQRDWIASLKLPRSEVRLESWSAHVPDSPYDSIVSIGAFEHFAKPGLSRDRRVNGYRSFFSRCHGCLRPEGRLSIQTIGLGAIRRLDQDRFIPSDIFPESDLPRLDEIVEGSEGIFELLCVYNDRLDYVTTLQRWIDNLKTNRNRAEKLVGHAVVNRYLKYFQLSRIGFVLGTTNLYRLTFRRQSRPVWQIS